MARRENQNNRSPFVGIIGLLIFLTVMYVLFKVVFGAISLLWAIMAFVAPILLILTMFLNFGVVKDYASSIVDSFKKKPSRGIIFSLATLIGYPIVSIYLFYKALITRKEKNEQVKTVKNKKKDEDYVKFEEVEDDDFLELPDLEEEAPKQEPLNRYDDLFSE